MKGSGPGAPPPVTRSLCWIHFLPSGPCPLAVPAWQNPNLGGAPFSPSTGTSKHSEKLTDPYGIQISEPCWSQTLTHGAKHTQDLSLLGHVLAISFSSHFITFSASPYTTQMIWDRLTNTSLLTCCSPSCSDMSINESESYSLVQTFPHFQGEHIILHRQKGLVWLTIIQWTYAKNGSHFVHLQKLIKMLWCFFRFMKDLCNLKWTILLRVVFL